MIVRSILTVPAKTNIKGRRAPKKNPIRDRAAKAQQEEERKEREKENQEILSNKSIGNMKPYNNQISIF